MLCRHKCWPWRGNVIGFHFKYFVFDHCNKYSLYFSCISRKLEHRPRGTGLSSRRSLPSSSLQKLNMIIPRPSATSTCMTLKQAPAFTRTECWMERSSSLLRTGCHREWLKSTKGARYNIQNFSLFLRCSWFLFSPIQVLPISIIENTLIITSRRWRRTLIWLSELRPEIILLEPKIYWGSIPFFKTGPKKQAR